jgi:diguanylate cyclase (GGDEF)-like protein
MAYLLVNMFTDVKKKLAILNASLEQKVIMQTVKLCEALEEVETANKKLFKISNTDPLTQLANRRSFFKVFSKEWKRACRNKSSVSIILLDIDNFKQYNDTYGHIAGDACLEKVAGILKKSAKRPLDLVARYGGEEFIILLPETDAKGAICVAESIRKALIAENIEHKNSATADRVTISAGCATAFPTMNDPRNNFINAADEALYNSKDNGRNLTTSINFYSRYK